MKFIELPQVLQEKVKTLRREARNHNIETPYEILTYNEAGTRFFRARRVCRSWNDDRGNSMPFGGGSYWTVNYGEVGWRRVKDLLGSGYDVELGFGKTFNRSANGTEIPKTLETKAEVMKLRSAIGIF